MLAFGLQFSLGSICDIEFKALCEILVTTSIHPHLASNSRTLLNLIATYHHVSGRSKISSPSVHSLTYVITRLCSSLVLSFKNSVTAGLTGLTCVNQQMPIEAYINYAYAFLDKANGGSIQLDLIMVIRVKDQWADASACDTKRVAATRGPKASVSVPGWKHFAHDADIGLCGWGTTVA